MRPLWAPIALFMLFVQQNVPLEVSGNEDKTGILFEDDFSGFRSGPISSVFGAQTEYHYLPVAGPKGGWWVSTFVSGPESELAWRVYRDRGFSEMVQVTRNRRAHTHPMLVAGDPLWRDYTLSVEFTPSSDAGRSGVVFRYRNDRCYYFFGVEKDHAVLRMVRHATGYRTPLEETLAGEPLEWTPGETLQAEVSLIGSRIQAELEGRVKLEADDETYAEGKIGLTSDVPTRYRRVVVRTSPEEKKAFEERVRKRNEEERKLQSENPLPVVWKKMKMEGLLHGKIKTDGFGVGRNLRFGDLNGDGVLDVLICQPHHRGPKDRNSEVGCLTAMTLDGEVLWQIGTPDPWKDFLTNDVGFQIHDLDGDGKSEVVYCRDFELVIGEGATGKTIRKVPLPKTPKQVRPPYNRFPRILGDAIHFADFRGVGRDQDIVIKSRYSHFWVYDDQLNLLWEGECNTGHYPFAHDVDADGRDEIMVGYTLFDHDGHRIWSLDGEARDHADGVAIANFQPGLGEELRLLCAASDEGLFLTDMAGKILKHHYIGHVQNVSIANFRDDLPGLEAVSINFWGNQGIVHFLDSSGDIYHDFEPCQHGSMMLPINWTGDAEEFFVLSANVEEGGLFDGWGRRAVRFSADGHPDMCNAVLDITGDCRDEIVVWDPHELWVYTQDNNPRAGRLFRPERNPLYNYSNYQTTVSSPGWLE